MYKKNLSLSGTQSDVASILLALACAPRILRISATDDGTEVNVTLLPPSIGSGDTTEYKLEGNTPAPSIVIPATTPDTYLVVEDVRMTEPAAIACLTTLNSGAYNNGYVNGSYHTEVLMPSPTDTYDRAVLRSPDGTKLADISFPDATDQLRITAAQVYSNEMKDNPVIAIGLIGDTKVYGIARQQIEDIPGQQLLLDNGQAIELPTSIVRISRANNSDGTVDVKLDDGRTAKISSDTTGALQLIEIQDAVTDELPDQATGWQNLGLSHAVIDVDGTPTRASVNPSEGSVSYRFTPKPLEAATARA